MKIYLYLAFLLLGFNEASAGQIKGQLLNYGTGNRVDVVSYSWMHYPPEFTDPSRYKKIKENFDLAFFDNVYIYANNFRYDDPTLHKVVFIDVCVDPAVKNIPHEKIVCFVWEPHQFNHSSEICNYYDRIYTFNDDLIDNKKFFKFHYPVLTPMVEEVTPFNQKRKCAMIASRWTAERIKIVDFFAAQPKNFLNVYGGGILELRPQYSDLKMIKGVVPGYPSSIDKRNVLKGYRFCICFENSHNVPGYITEKIFDVFAAGCVPIYWGPDNIEQFVPPECFVDYRKFKNDEEMYEFIVSIQEEEYNQYLTNIRAFLESDKAKLFSLEAFEEILYNAVKE